MTRERFSFQSLWKPILAVTLVAIMPNDASAGAKPALRRPGAVTLGRLAEGGPRGERREVVLREGGRPEAISEPAKPFPVEAAWELAGRLRDHLERGSREESGAGGPLAGLDGRLAHFEGRLAAFSSSALSPEEMEALWSEFTHLENLEGQLSKPRRATRALDPSLLAAFKGEGAAAEGQPEATTKVNTGWILDRHVYDDAGAKTYPTFAADIRNYDEGGSDVALDGDGFVWAVHSFWWTDTVLVFPDHPSPSYCLAIYTSKDGGGTWDLYSILYDPASKDLINPELAIDINASPNRYFIAYEYAYDASDHDIYVFSDNSPMGGGGSNPQDAAIATSALMERNPDVASDYTAGATAYQVVAYEKEYTTGSGDFDVYASQATGAGASGQLLQNEGFESGATIWVQSPTDIIDNSPSPPPNTGSWKAWLCGADNRNDSLYQTVTIPANAQFVQLYFYQRITTNETSGTWDFLHIRVRNNTGGLITTLATFNNSHSTTYANYTLLTYDLSAYKGQTVRIAYEATTDSGLSSSFYIDDTWLSWSEWTASAAVASSASAETNPSLFAGATGAGPAYTPYVHLAYNYDSSQHLLNPGFELGNNGNWTVQSAGDISCNGANTRTGTCKSWLGGADNSSDWIYQTVTIPADATSAWLSIYLKIVSDETGATPYDYFRLKLKNTSGTDIVTLATYSNADEAAFASYVGLSYNLIAYKGTTFRVYMEGTTDNGLVTSFYVDDTSLTVISPSNATHIVAYANAVHPSGGTAYPTGLRNFSKLGVLPSSGASQPYGPPSVAATHGGGTAPYPYSRVLVTAEQYFPADVPTVGDPARYQLAISRNMCNGATTCPDMTCSPSNLPLTWSAFYFYDNKSDERSPSLIVDGMGLTTNGLGYAAGDHPYLYMAFYHRSKTSLSPYGEAQMIITDPSDETCDGFVSDAWYYFTASPKASDDDDLVVANPGTLVAFNYWDVYPGVVFSKMYPHFGGTENLDVYYTTLGDNYTFDTASGGSHINATFSMDTIIYVGPWTFAWPAGFQWDVLTGSPQEVDGRYYIFNSWSDGTLTPAVQVTSDWCDGFNPCPYLDYTAFFDGGCLIAQQEVGGVNGTKNGSGNAVLTWNPPAQQGDVGTYTVFRATDPSSASNYTPVASTVDPTYTDLNAPGSLYYYVVTGTCGPYGGPWGHYGQ